ncbi:hypothetical protein GGD67_002651 [Bradyrhizobium sp. IAR9]|uniref:hypothetical protein n=1 Tax=Bradyrhizobium sp. IAR9 TaxID=2663841 RepID=UPI0017C35949|nr:hypothetical protein [Bradyrhizobium sp. IAR9]NYG45193.1 hypothetical protein [Bradyrhizobium sp. IAR9]
MRLIRFILIDLALMLLAPENAEAMTMATGANFKSATKAVGSLMRISGSEPVFSSGVSRHVYRQSSQAAPFGHSAESLRPEEQAQNSRCWTGALPLIGKRTGQRPIVKILAARGYSTSLWS